jgi:hypothetical protein
MLADRKLLFHWWVCWIPTFQEETVIHTGGIKGMMTLWSSDWGLCPGRWKCSWRARVRCFRVPFFPFG